MIPYPLVTARDYILARNENMTKDELEILINKNPASYRALNTIIALKQAIYLLSKAEYSNEELTKSLTSHLQSGIIVYNSTDPIEPFDEKFYDDFKNQIIKLVDNLREIDYSGMDLALFVVYRNPIDFPQKYVVRLQGYVNGKHYLTNLVMVKNTYEECRKEINRAGFNIRVPRDEQDDKSIVECWIC
jgi:hypothetical protein